MRLAGICPSRSVGLSSYRQTAGPKSVRKPSRYVPAAEVDSAFYPRGAVK